MTGTMVSHQANNDGLPQYHLRRIGRRPSRPDVSNFIDFKKRITLIGRNREVVDYVLNTANEAQNRSISRIHARVIRALPSNRHRLVDSSFTGVYINDRRQDGDVILREGDTVTFGHPQSSCLDQGKRIRQPNSEFHFLFELCDCKIGQGTEQGQELRLCTTPLTPLVLSAAFPRFSTPALLLGTASGLMPGQLSSTGDTGGKTALHDLGKPTAVTEVQNHPPLANGVQWLPFAHCSPEWMELASQGNDSTDPDAPLPVTLAQPSLMPISVIGVNPITSGSIVGVHLHSQTQGCGPFPPELLAVWNERLNEPTASGDGESSRRQLANSDERLSSREAGQLLSEGLETRASPSGQGGGAGANHHFTSLSMSRCHRDGSKHEGEASLPADASTLQEGICTSPLSCPNIVQDAQDETQGKIQGTTMNIANSGGEPVMGTERAFATKKALPNDTGAVDAALPDDTKVSKATEAAGPRLDLDTTGQFNLCQGEDTLTEFTVQDTQDLENSGSSIREACRDSVSSNCQMRENELHVQNEDCHLQLSRGGDLVMGSISFYKAAQGQDCPTWSIVENTSATVTLAPLGKRQHDAMGNSPENTHAQHYSASNKSPRTQTPECSGNLSKKLQVIYQGRDVPGQDLPLKGRLATTYIGNKESERFPGDPQRLLADPAWAEEELPLSTVAVNPITVDAEFTALNGESIGASLDGDHLDEAQATAGGDYIRPAGRSVCENGEQQLPDHSHSCTIVGDKQETISILALWTQAHNSFPEAVSSLLTKQMGKDGNLIHSETTEGLGFLVESQVSHKQKVLSVGCSQDRKPMEDGKSSVQLPPTVSDTLWAKFSTLDNSVPKADSSTCVAEAKPEPKVAVEMTGHNNSFPVNTFSMSGSSNTGAKNGNDQWVMPNMKLCSSPVGSGLVDREGAQEHISTAGQPMEGHCVCVTNQRGLETGLSGMEMGVSEMEMGVSGMETGVSEMEMGLSGMETGVSEMEMGLSGMETGVSGELSMGVSGELQMDVSEMVTDVSGMETGVSIMESSVSRELKMGVSGDPQMGVSELGMGVSGDPETGVSEMVIDVSGMETGVSGELETGASGELETGASGELETGASGELETGTSGELETGASGELQTGVSGDPQMGVSELEMGVSGEPETGVSGEPVTGVSEMVTDVTGMETGVSIMESSVSRELEMSVSGMDTGASGELEMGVSWVPDLCEQSDGLRCDSGLPPLEQIMCQTSVIPILGRMEKVCDIGIGVEQCGPHVAEGDSDIKDASAMLYLSPKADAEELGDPAKMDKNVEVDLVPECVSGKMDVINLHPKGVARNVPSPEVEVTTSSTILERDVINEPKLLATSVAVSADMELQHEVSPYRRVDAHSELEQTESLAMPPWLSECVEPKPHRGEDGGVWPGSSALTVTFHSSGMQVGEAVDLLMPAGDPVAALVKLDAAAAPVSVAGVPPSCVSLPTSATASSPTQTERPSQAWTERAGEQRHREHLALKRLTCSVPSSVTVGLGDDSSLRFLMGPPGSENVVCLGEDSGLSLTEEPPMGQNAEGHSPAMPEDGEGVSTFESERAEESYLVCQNLTTRTVPGTTVLGGHREDFTVTGKTDLSSNSCVMETSKCEATEGGNQELCLVQWMHPAALGMSETERFSLPSALLNNGCGQVKEAKIAGSPLTPLGNVPTGWLTAAATPMSLGLPVPEGGTETTAPKGPVSEGGTDSTGSLGPLVPVEGTDTSMSLGLSIPEGGADITIPQGPVPEEETEIPMLLDLTVTEGGAENTGPLGPVPERGTNITAPQGPIVPEGGTDIIAPGLRTDLTAPQGQSVSEGETNITAPQGPFNPEGETVITAPQGHTVPGGETDITASWGHSVPEGGTDFTAPQVQSVPEGETVITAPQGQTVPAGETDIIAPGHRTVITAQWGLSIPEGGPDITAPQGHTVPEGGTDFIAPQGHSVPEGETDITASWGHSVPEGGTDFTAPQGQSVSDGETVITAPQDQSVSEGEMDITGPQDHSVSEGETDITAPGLQTGITAPQGHTVPEGGIDITAPQGHSVPERETDLPAPQGHSIPERETDLPAPQGQSVPEGGTDITAPGLRTNITAPQGQSVPEGGTDITAPQGQSVPEGGTDITAPQGHSVPEGETDLPAPQGHSVPEGETDLPAPQGYTVPEGETDLPASQGYTVPEGETDLPAPQGYTVPEGETDLPAPQGYTVPEGETDLPASQGYTVPEGAALLQGPVDIREKGFGKEVLVAACNGGGSGFQQNQGLLGAAVLAVPTTAEQKVTVDASCPNTERNDDIAPDEWLLSSEKQLLTDATLMGELCGEEGDQPALIKDSACLIAGYRKQMKQRPTSAEEANRGAVNKSPVSQSSQFPSGCIKVLTSAELVGDQPPNWKRAELQEEADQTTSWGAEKDEGRRGESVPVLSDAAVRHLEYHSLLQGGDQLEALSASGPGQVDASPRKERAEGQQSGSGRGSKQRSVGSNELSARVHPSDLSVAGCVLETELSCSCPGDPNTQEERVDHSSFAITVQEAGDARSICKTCGAGEKPRGSGDQEPVGERHETSKESPAPEWNSRPSPVQALQMPRVWTAGIQEEPPRASPVSDNQQLHTKACSKAVLPLALIKPHALEDERLDGQKGLDERTNLVSNTIFSVGLRSPYEMGQEVDKDSTERDDSANFSEAWSMGWILGNQVPDNSKNEATRLEQGDGLSMRADGFGPSTESNLPVSYNQTVTEMAISSITNPATGAGVNLCQTLAAVGANGQNLATKELLLDPCPQTRCSKVTSVPVGESAEDLQLEDWRPEENCNSCLPGLPRDSDLLERPRFSKQAEVDPQCIAEEVNARELSGSKEFGIKSELDRGATKGTLGKNEVCATSHSPTYILKESIGTIETPIHCSHLSNNPRGTDKNLQQQSIVEIQNEDLLEKCRSSNAVGQPRTERVEVCAFEQDSQQGKVIQPSEGKESSLPEVPLAEVSWGKPMAVSVDSDVELERVEVSHQDLSRNKVENYNKVNLGLGADSTNIQLSLECLNAQPSESESEEENGAGSWRSDALSHSGIRTLKRPRLSEVADSNFRTTKPSKRSRTCRQTRAVGLRAAEGIKLSLQSFSKQLRQVQANYIGRLVQQFFTEYTQPWKRWVPKLVVVNRKDEVEIIVKKFFEALSIQSKAKAVDKSQQRVKPIASQQSMGLISELGQESREGDESSRQKQDAQLESPGLIGQGLARTHGPGGASFSKTAGPSSETSWRDLVDSDSETCPLQEGSGVAKESDTMQERSWHTKSEILSSSTHLDQISSAIAPGDVQEPAVEDFGLSFWLTHDEKVSAEKAEAFCAREMGPLLLPQCPSIVESLEQPGDDTYGESQRLGQKDTSCDGGTEEMACGGREPLSLEMPNSPLNPCGSARVECVEGGRTDERSSSSPAHLLADLVVDADVAGVLHDGRSSSDSSALILDIQPPDLAEASRIQEDLCHPGHNQDQCYKVMNVQPTALGCRKLLQCDSMDGLNVAQMACTDNKIKPDNTSFNSRSNNKVEVINVLEPSVLHHKIVGQNDGKIGLKIAESSALRSDGDNGVEPENEELLDHNNLSYSSTELECAKHLALTYDDLDYKDKGMNGVNIAEPSALAHDTPTSLTGRESASPLGQSTELQRSPSRLLDAETALQVAHSDRVELGQNLGGRRFLELPGPPRPDQRRDFGGKAGMVGCRPSGRSAREHQSGMAESFHLPANQLSGLEVKNHEGPGSQSAMAKNPTCSERWKSVGSFKSMEKPYLEMSRAAGAHRSRFNIDRRAHGEVFPESQVAAETAGESLPASSVPFAEDVKTEKGYGLADGVDCSSPDPFLPMVMPRARDCPEMLAKHRDMSPVLTDPQGALRPAMSEQPAHQMVEGTRLDAGVAKAISPHGWLSSPDCPNVAGGQQPARTSLLLSISRGIGESGTRVGYMGCERVDRENKLRLKANNEKNGSDREIGERVCGQWSRATSSLAQLDCLPPASGVGNGLIAPTTRFSPPSRAPPSSSHNPSLPETAPDATSWRSLEWNDMPSPLENPSVRFPALRNSSSTPTEALHPQPTQSSSAQPRCKSESGLLSDTRDQSLPVISQDPPFHSDSRAFHIPNEPLSCGFDNKVKLPTAAVEQVLYSKGNLDQKSSRDYTSGICGVSSLGSDLDFSKGSHHPRHGEGNGDTRTQLDSSPSECDPCSSWTPSRSEAIVKTKCHSAGTVEGLQRSLLPKHQGEKSMETCKPWAPSARFLLQSPEHHWASSDQVIRSQLRECHFLLQDISEALQAKGVAEEHVADWKEQIKELEKQTVPPPTYIAVVGDTGSGKSSLLNALLDEEGILPTSAMRACTAVVVEVSLNTKSDHYRADVEFFSEEEWNKELLSLLSDMTDKYGRLRRRRPDPGSEASMAYSRVKAVYGKILLYQELKQLQEVTQYLGTTTTICEMQASEFRSKVQCFIDTRINDFSSSRGGEFWPIVKRVRIQVPKSSVLQTGAVLVDLPGVRDSNDARNSVAKEYLKTCDAVWIVANVTRAVDDKTAKETLDESLRRQLLMDGQFGCIAFICTKTDSHNVTEIMSALSLSDECNPLEEQIAKLRNEIEQRQVDHKNWTSDLEKARRSNQNGERAKQLEMAIKQLEVNLTKLHSEVSMNQSKLSLNSIKARNFFCKQKIYLNFKRGLQDLKNQARAEDTDSDEEQDETDDDGVEDDEVHPSMADPCLESHLPVFTVSSTEYLKLRDKLQRDGPPRVFHNIEDTEIPAVQKFVHQITLARKALGTEVVIRQLATFVSHIVNYLTNRRAQNANYQAKIQEALQDCLSCVRELFQQAAEDCSRDIENSFTTIRMHLNTGKKKAMRICESTVLRWGSRLPIGYPYPTYKATCSRNGIFSSSACGSIDFNEELSHPLLTSVQVIWNEVFSVSIPQHLTRFKADVLGKLEYFFNDLMQRLKWIEGDTQPVNYILLQQLNAVRAKLENFALKLLDVISARQRSISRILTPAVQSGMMPAYLKCASESGPGCFVQMKSCMEQHMHFQKEQLFTTACRKLGDQLDLLKQEIHSRLKLFLDEICNELLVQFEPLLKPLKIIDEIIPKLVNICRTTTAVCQRSHIDFTLPKFEEDNEEPGPAKLLRKPLGSGTPPLQELKKFLGRVKIMKINNVEVTPTAPVEILMDKLLLKYKVPDTQTPCEQPVPFQCLSACEFCPSIPFLILTYKKKYKSKERTDVVLLDEDQAMFGQWMEAVAERWQGQLEFRCLEVVQAVERLHFLHVIYQGSETKDPNEEEEVSCVWPRSNEDSSSSSCVFVGNFPPSRKRQWGEMDPPGVLSVPQGPSSWGQRSWINEEIQTQPPQLKKEKRDWQASRHSQDCEYRLKLPVLKKEFCDSAEEDFDSL